MLNCAQIKMPVSEAIRLAGGASAVARRVGISNQAVSAWGRKGIPRTEYTGETEYIKTICLMAAERGHYIDLDRVQWRPA